MMMKEDLFVFHLDSLYKNRKPVFSTGIVQGEAGLALCYFYLFKTTNENCYFEKMHKILDNLIDHVKNDYSLGYGLTGLCWMVDLMKNEIEGSEGWLGEANNILLKKTDFLLQQGNLDFFQGAVGMLFYFLTQNNTTEYISLLENLLKIIDEKIRKNDWEIKSFRGDKWVFEINLGVPHGMTGILLFLLLIKEKNILKVDDQILKLAELLFSYQRTNPEKCYFPSKIVEGNESLDSCIGWCYGDLTVGYALLKTGVLFNIKEYENISLSILRNTIDRDDYFHDVMMLCHGYVSNALIYNRICKFSKEKCFQEAADKWEILADDLYKKQYKSFIEKKEYSDFFDDPSLFYGFPGLFLAKMSWDNKIDLKWSDCLLL